MAVYYDETKKSWYCKFRYTDWTGKSRHTTKRGFKRKADAKAYEIDFKRSVTDSPDMSVKALCDRYIVTIRSRQRESTVYQKQKFLEKHVVPKIGSLPLSALTPSVMVEWQNYLLSMLSPGAARCGHTRLSTLLNFAVKMGWLQNNPLSKVGVIGKVAKRQKFWTFEEYQRFRQAVLDDKKNRKGAFFYATCFDVLFYSGMRLSEFLGLGVDDIDGNVIHIRKSWHEAFDSTALKNEASHRVVTMPPSVMDEVRQYISMLPECPETRLFYISEGVLRRHMKDASKAAGLPYITIHGLRHSHVSHLISLGMPLPVISRRVGHVSPNITLAVYSHMYSTDADEVSTTLEQIVGQSLVKGKNNTPQS